MIHVLEYSPSQKAFHRCTLEEAVETNRQNFNRGTNLDWVIIAQGTWEEMATLGSQLQEEYEHRVQ